MYYRRVMIIFLIDHRAAGFAKKARVLDTHTTDSRSSARNNSPNTIGIDANREP